MPADYAAPRIERTLADIPQGTVYKIIFFFSSRSRHTIFDCDWISDVCSPDLQIVRQFLERSDARDRPQIRRAQASELAPGMPTPASPACAGLSNQIELPAQRRRRAGRC